jgi:peptidyl-prolyl cis-trans isomerase A (cyclophilin A)
MSVHFKLEKMNKSSGKLFMILIIPVIVSMIEIKNPSVVIRTEFGEIFVEIYTDRAPVTANNFLRYVDSGLFRGACFYRIVRPDNQLKDSVKIEVIQGGRYEDEEKGFPPIPHENTLATGILHKDGVISMARLNPGSATSEFFICVGDQPELDYGGRRNRDGQGFAAFGRVIKGMDVVRKIHSIEAPSQYPERKVLISDIVRE